MTTTLHCSENYFFAIVMAFSSALVIAIVFVIMLPFALYQVNYNNHILPTNCMVVEKNIVRLAFHHTVEWKMSFLIENGRTAIEYLTKRFSTYYEAQMGAEMYMLNQSYPCFYQDDTKMLYMTKEETDFAGMYLFFGICFTISILVALLLTAYKLIPFYWKKYSMRDRIYIMLPE